MRRSFSDTLLMTSFALASVVSNISKAADSNVNQPLFQIAGKAYTVKDLSPSDQNRLHEMEMNFYKTIEGLARQKYVETKSNPHSGLNTKDKPYAAEEKWLNKSYAPSSGEIDKALETYKDEKQLQQLPVSERGKVVERFLASQNRSKVLTEVTEKAIEKGEIRVAIPQPVAPTVEIAKSAQAVIGNPKNPIRIVEFTDFQCPYCKRLSNVSSEVLKKHGDSVVWEVRHFPLSFHKQARDAAAAVYCASVQGKLLEAKKWVFEAQEKLAEEKIFQQMGRALSLNVGEFDKCRSHENTARIIESDLKEGERLGVAGTPTVFVNGRKFQGDPQSLEAWDAMIKTARPADHSL